MLHKAWNSKGEMPYCFPRSSIKFQGHTVLNMTDFDPNWTFPDYRPVAAFKSLRFALFLNCALVQQVSDLILKTALLRFIDEYIQWWTWWSLVQVMACCLLGTRSFITWTNADLLQTKLLGKKIVKFETGYKIVVSGKCIWKCCLQNGGHFGQTYMC